MSRVIVTGGTKDDIAPIGVFALNIAKTNRNVFDKLIVFHDGIKKKDQEIINSIFPAEFVRYVYPNKSKNDGVITYFSPMVFCKYECFALLEKYDEVVWSDYDVVILKDISDFCILKPGCANFLKSDMTLKSMLYTEIVNKEILDYDIESIGICTPLFAISKSIRNHESISEWCYQKTSLWDVDLYLPEQCVFSAAIKEFDIPIQFFEFDKYACFPKDAKGDEYILHAAGPVKFWNGMHNDFWEELYLEWLNAGGSKYSEKKKRLNRKIKLIFSRITGVKSRNKDQR